MSQLLFRNRWFALVWALLICFSISRFFDEGGGQEQLTKAAADIRTSRVQAARAQSAVQQDIEESQVIRGRTMHEDGAVQFEADYTDRPASEGEGY
jgi:hypothetical protein